jgi:hypothetical protein
MTYRAPANEPVARERPPEILGFALYVLGTGCAALGLSQLGTFAKIHGHASLARLPWWASTVGQLMVLVGLAIAWRTTRTRQRRVLVVSAALWLTLLVVDYQARLYAAPLLGRAIVLGLVAMFVHSVGRGFAASTWATTVGAVLVAADAWARTWPVVLHLGKVSDRVMLAFAPPSMVASAIGFVVAGAGLYASGRSVLRGITVDEYVRAHPKKGGEDDADASVVPGLRAGAPLLAESAIGVAALAFVRAAAVASAHTLAMSPRDVSETTTLGGELVALTLLVVALRRMRPLAARPRLLAHAALALLLVELGLVILSWMSGSYRSVYDVSTFVAVAPPLLAAGCLYTCSSVGVLARAAGRLRLSGAALAASAVASFLAAHTADPDGRFALEMLAIVSGAIAVYATITVARDVRRVELDLAREPVTLIRS